MDKWNQSFSVGVSELDRQHQRLFEMFYTLLELQGDSGSTEAIARTLSELKAYTREHFALEEKYMAECDYPELDTHRLLHNAFRKKVDILCSAQSQNVDLTAVVTQLYEWLVTHVCSFDRQYAPYLAQRTTAV